MIILSINDWFDNIGGAINTLKELIFSFYKIVTSIFSFIPEPFGTILGVALIATIAITIIKLVRG